MKGSKKLSEKVMTWIQEYNPFEDEGLYSSNVESVFLVGSRAKGTNREDSDWDVAVVWPADLRIEGELESSLKLSEKLHMALGWTMPNNTDGNAIDIQVFFSDDECLNEYAKIDLMKKSLKKTRKM